MRALALLTAMLLPLIGAGGDRSLRLERLGALARIEAVPVAIDPVDPARRRVGGLTYLGGVRLTSPDPMFGGYSALTVEGDRFTLLSDGGHVVRFRMGSDWRLREPSFANLVDGPGTGWSKIDRDSESLVVDRASGRAWIGFEHWNQIWRYDADLRRAQAHAAPAAMRSWDLNGGPEAMARLRGGAFLVISEFSWFNKSGARMGLWFADDPTRRPVPAFRFGYRPPKGFNPADMTQLPDGRLLILNRDFGLRHLFRVTLTLVDPREIRPGAIVRGREIATLAAPLLHDNFEGVAAMREGDATVLWIVSDDNRQPWEQTLLLKFRLDG